MPFFPSFQPASVCLFVLRLYGPVNPMDHVDMVSLPNHTFTGQAWFSKLLTSIVHILSPAPASMPNNYSES